VAQLDMRFLYIEPIAATLALRMVLEMRVSTPERASAVSTLLSNNAATMQTAMMTAAAASSTGTATDVTAVTIILSSVHILSKTGTVVYTAPQGLGIGAIVGIIIAVIAVVAISAALLYYCLVIKKRSTEVETTAGGQAAGVSAANAAGFNGAPAPGHPGHANAAFPSVVQGHHQGHMLQHYAPHLFNYPPPTATATADMVYSRVRQ